MKYNSQSRHLVWLIIRFVFIIAALIVILIMGTHWLVGELPRKVIAFVSSREGRRDIYLMDMSGAQTIRITQKEGDYCCLSWSPDGERLAYGFTKGGFGTGKVTIHVMDRNGSNSHQLTAGDLDLRSPVWSPDGQEIALSDFTAVDVNHPAAIVVLKVDMKGAQPSFPSYVQGENPVWSPDGSQIAFVTRVTTTRQLYVMNRDGTNQHRLTQSYGNDVTPAWSPDGSKIAFSSFRSGKKANIYVIPVACLSTVEGCQGVEQLLTDGSANLASPAWSLDGREIAYLSDQTGVWQIYVMAVDGSHQRRLTHRNFNVNSFAWQP